MSKRYKFPRIPHLPWSLAKSADDIDLQDVSVFVGKEVVVTTKLDGENSSIYSDAYVHARSTDSRHHPSRSWLKQFAAKIAREIPEGWRLSGENLFAFHSILYSNLPSYFFAFAIFDDNNTCLSWKDLEEFTALMGIQTVPVLYQGIWDEDLIKNINFNQSNFATFRCKTDAPASIDDFEPCSQEGYVIRLAEAFPWDQYGASAAKMVRKNHVQTDEHWMHKQTFPNLLKNN